jgi:hypothetical protein
MKSGAGGIAFIIGRMRNRNMTTHLISFYKKFGDRIIPFFAVKASLTRLLAIVYSIQMNLQRYETIAVSNHKRYELLSVGPKRAIKKVVSYIEVAPGIYNLGFGDWEETTQKIIDTVRSNNEDRDKVLATVAFTVIDFMKYYPGALILAEGETPVKTRLYQMAINANWGEINQLFDIKGLVGETWEPFNRNKSYEAFALHARRNW